jgi:hypothetical protein
MFKSFLEKRRKNKIVAPIHEYIGNEVPTRYLNTIGDDRKHVANEVILLRAIATEISESSNPPAQLRVRLYEALRQLAPMQVLALTPTEKRDAFFDECAYISGAFSHRLDYVVPQVSFLREIWIDQQLNRLSNAELLTFCNHAALTAKIRANVINELRAWFDVGSIDPHSDWFRKVFLANVIISECEIRDDLGEDLILARDPIDAGLRRVSISLLAKDYLLNAQNPYEAWRDALREGGKELTDLGFRGSKFQGDSPLR